MKPKENIFENIEDPESNENSNDDESLLEEYSSDIGSEISNISLNEETSNEDIEFPTMENIEKRYPFNELKYSNRNLASEENNIGFNNYCTIPGSTACIPQTHYQFQNQISGSISGSYKTQIKNSTNPYSNELIIPSNAKSLESRVKSESTQSSDAVPEVDIYDVPMISVESKEIESVGATDSNSSNIYTSFPKIFRKLSLEEKRIEKLRDIINHIEYIRKEDDKRLKKCTEFYTEDFETVRVIGTGSFGTVTASFHKKIMKYYAIKYLDKEMLSEQESYLDDVLNEIAILYSFKNSKFLNCCYGYVQTKKAFGIVMDLHTGGDLFSLLGEENKFPRPCRIYVAAEVLAGLSELHERGILYRDLKPENILLASDGHIILTDFGYSKKLKKNGRTLTLVGTPEYTAPEILRREDYAFEADIWSYGVLLYEIFCDMPPFDLHEVDSKAEKYARILEGSLSFPCGLARDLVDLISSVLQEDPRKRITLEQIKKHTFFRNIDWKLIEEKKLPREYLPPIVIDNMDVTRNFDFFPDVYGAAFLDF